MTSELFHTEPQDFTDPSDLLQAFINELAFINDDQGDLQDFAIRTMKAAEHAQIALAMIHGSELYRFSGAKEDGHYWNFGGFQTHGEASAFMDFLSHCGYIDFSDIEHE